MAEGARAWVRPDWLFETLLRQSRGVVRAEVALPEELPEDSRPWSRNQKVSGDTWELSRPREWAYRPRPSKSSLLPGGHPQ